MKNIHWRWQLTSQRRTFRGRVILLAAFIPLALLIAAGCASDKAPMAEKPGEQTAAAHSTANPPAPVPHKLSGAELYSMNCNRCHQERYPTERTAAQWRTVLL